MNHGSEVEAGNTVRNLDPYQQFKNIHGLWSLREAELLQG